MNIIFNANRGEPLTVRTTLSNMGLGVFSLFRFRPDGSTEAIGKRVSPPPEAAVTAGAAVFEVSTEALEALGWANQSFQVRSLAGLPGGGTMPAFLQVSQSSGSLAPEDLQGQPIQQLQNGVELDPPLTHNVPGLWTFRVRFQ